MPENRMALFNCVFCLLPEPGLSCIIYLWFSEDLPAASIRFQDGTSIGNGKKKMEKKKTFVKAGNTMKEGNTQKKVGGVAANRLMPPVLIVLSALHIIIIAAIVMISQSSSSLSQVMQNAGIYTREATSLLAGSSLLSETAGNYVLMPSTETGEVNANPLFSYAAELSQPQRRGAQVLAKFREYGVDEDVMAMIETAAASADFLMQNQIHAITLMRTMYPLPEDGPLAAIPKMELTQEEWNMTDAEKISLAHELILGAEYGQNKSAVSQNINACVARLTAISEAQAAAFRSRVDLYRTLLWIVTVAIILILICTFGAQYRLILNPLDRFVKMIPSGMMLDEKRGFHEVRLVARAYNDVLKRRDALDAILRSAAETDALTNLPNRYSFERYRMDLEESGCPVAVLLFDINYLKQTNDSHGHHAGDQLIREAAACISTCFSDAESNNCFRFGGDEFAAIIKNCTKQSIRKMVEKFKEIEKERNISISLGYAYTDEIGKTSFKQLLEEADRQMYVNKKAAHENA